MTFDDLKFIPRSNGPVDPLGFIFGFNGSRAECHFPNGYGVSVIDDGYGSDEELFEIAVLYGGVITYDSPLTDDVLGCLTKEDVTRHMQEVAALPARGES